MDTTEIVVRSARALPEAEAWSLVLESLGIHHRVIASDTGWVIVVQPADAARAATALAAQDREASEEADREPAAPDVGASSMPVVLAMGLVAFFLITGPRRSSFGVSAWFRAGSAVADEIVRGAWWRAVTALTLHADLAHVLGNAAALIIFVSALCRWLGPGVASLLVLISGVGGNLVTAYLYGSHHDSVGASTAAFGALGLLGGLQFVRRYRVTTRLGRRRRALTAVAACLGLLAMIGVGERTDVVAHVAGLACGLLLGLATGALVRRPAPPLLQWALIAAAALLVVGSWWVALSGGGPGPPG